MVTRVLRASALLTGLDEFRARVRAKMMVFKKTPANRLRFGTIIVSAHKVKLSDNPSALVAADMTKFKSDFRSCLIGHLTRGVRVAGVFEIDIVTPKLLTAGKRALLNKIDIAAISPDEQVIIVHVHMLIDCRGYASPEVLGRDLRKQFPGPRRIVLKELYSDNVASEIENLAGYFTKHIRAYSNAYDDDGRKVKFTVNFDRAWAVWLDRLYMNISLDNTLYSTTTSRASEKVECKHKTTKPLIPQAFSMISNEDQLRDAKRGKVRARTVAAHAGERSHEIDKHTARTTSHPSQMVAEHSAEPFDDDEPMVFRLMKRIMQQNIGLSHPMKYFRQNGT